MVLMRGALRFGVLVYDPVWAAAGVSPWSQAILAGAFRHREDADRKAMSIAGVADLNGLDLEAVVVPVLPGNTSARDIAKEVTT